MVCPGFLTCVSVSAECNSRKRVLIGKLDLDLRANVVTEELSEFGTDESEAAHKENKVCCPLEQPKRSREITPAERFPRLRNRRPHSVAARHHLSI